MEVIKRDVSVQRYYPDVLAAAKEFKALAAAENPEYAVLWDALWKWFANTFVVDIDEDGAARWESMLGLHKLPEDTLQDRRMRILIAINAVIPYTIRRLQQILDAGYGEGMAVASTNTDYELWVDVDNSIIFSTVPMRIMLRAIVPANLSINIGQTIPAKAGFFVGGKISLYQTINVQTGSGFAMDDMEKTLFAGGRVGSLHIIELKSEEV